jgi:ribosomal protein L11 methyltransferase
VVAQAAAAFGLPPFPLGAPLVEEIRAQDWEASIRESYLPVEVGPGLWVVPAWSPPPSDPGAVVVLLEPGLAFGTGDHPTTRLCLRWLHAQRLGGRSVMDYGTGSGVLAAAALVMGAARAVGTDVEPLAVRAAAQNAALNGVGARLTALVCSADVAGEEPMAAAGAPPEERLFDVCVNVRPAVPPPPPALCVGAALRCAAVRRPS